MWKLLIQKTRTRPYKRNNFWYSCVMDKKDTPPEQQQQHHHHSSSTVAPTPTVGGGVTGGSVGSGGAQTGEKRKSIVSATSSDSNHPQRRKGSLISEDSFHIENSIPGNKPVFKKREQEWIKKPPVYHQVVKYSPRTNVTWGWPSRTIMPFLRGSIFFIFYFALYRLLFE